ncbi:hypothetical protein CRG98_024713 [Punica granatum]|uniref:Uncharacterized protein n=1 Tax=Punica granatum TaxID=22663 RepID=A0A2I0JF46_PUNGR|nr:hypothetical protein CRG98_024713 [Punica granatum]
MGQDRGCFADTQHLLVTSSAIIVTTAPPWSPPFIPQLQDFTTISFSSDPSLVAAAPPLLLLLNNNSTTSTSQLRLLHLNAPTVVSLLSNPSWCSNSDAANTLSLAYQPPSHRSSVPHSPSYQAHPRLMGKAG